LTNPEAISCSISTGPAPSMFMAVRDTKCVRARSILRGHEALKHLQATSSLSFPSLDPHEGQASGGENGTFAEVRLSAMTATTFGMISPPFSIFHDVADANVKATDFVIIVQSGVAYGGPGQKHGFHPGDRRDDAGPSHLGVDGKHFCQGAFGLVLVGDYPARDLPSIPAAPVVRDCLP